MGLHVAIQPHHVADRYSFGDAGYQRYAGIHRLRDGVARERRRNENQRDVRAGRFYRLTNRVKNRYRIVELLTAPSRGHHGNQLRPVLFAGSGVKTPLSSGDALHQNTGLFVDQNPHCL